MEKTIMNKPQTIKPLTPEERKRMTDEIIAILKELAEEPKD